MLCQFWNKAAFIKYKYFQSFFNLDTKLLLFPTDLLVITTVNGKLWSFPVQELSESGNGLLQISRGRLRRPVPHCTCLVVKKFTEQPHVGVYFYSNCTSEKAPLDFGLWVAAKTWNLMYFLTPVRNIIKTSIPQSLSITLKTRKKIRCTYHLSARTHLYSFSLHKPGWRPHWEWWGQVGTQLGSLYFSLR